MSDVDLTKLKLRYVPPEDYEDEEEEEDEAPPPAKRAKVREYEIRQDDQVLGTLEFFYIDAKDPGVDFFLDLDGFSREASDVAFELFDRSGQLQKRYIRQGTRVWGRETTATGKIFYLKELKIKRPFQRKGVGRWALQELLNSTSDKKLKNMRFLFCWPAALTNEFEDVMFRRELGATAAETRQLADEQERFEKAQDGAVVFFQKAGFRRVGTTRFFCCARDTEHPSRKIKPEDDAKLDEKEDEEDPVNDEGLTRYDMFRRSAGMPYR
ncbi:hypothetical protein JCM6882_006428 [Rhodosporidiobolus microsporus]